MTTYNTYTVMRRYPIDAISNVGEQGSRKPDGSSARVNIVTQT
jgi:hypothetical protein